MDESSNRRVEHTSWKISIRSLFNSVIRKNGDLVTVHIKIPIIIIGPIIGRLSSTLIHIIIMVHENALCILFI